ncbi:hypothetical protein BS47DRAFT_1339014, partial [Hydnum rufescens UP504]
MDLYTNANITIVHEVSTPPEIAGIVGAMFNCALQGSVGCDPRLHRVSENAKQIVKGRVPGY